jgi:hypothetical protein
MNHRNQFAGWERQSTNELLQRGSMDKPRDVISFPDAQNVANQIQQLRVNAQPSPTSTLRVPRIQNSVPSVPKPVTGIRVNRLPIPGTNNLKVTVRFQRDPADVAFQSANVYLKQAGGNHNLVGSTSSTSASFVVAKTGASSVVTIQSVGSNNARPLENSPGRAINLA